MRINTRKDQELENYFGRIKATFSSKFLATMVDFILVMAICFPFFIYICYFDFKDWTLEKLKEPWTKFATKTEKPNSGLVVVCCLLLLFVEYIYFVFIPSVFRVRTFGCKCFNISAITINDCLNWRQKIKQSQLIRANALPVFAIPFLNLVFFSIPYFLGKGEDWTNWMKSSKTAVPVIKASVVILFALQIHYLFTVAASRKALNYFTKSNGIVYVNVRKAKILMSTEDKPLPNKENLDQIDLPGMNALALNALKNKKEKNIPLDEFDSIDFSQESSIPKSSL